MSRFSSRSIELTLASAKETMVFNEIVRMAIDSFQANKIRFAMTALGMVIGTASLILVVTIGLTGKQYILNSIQNIGANLIEADYEGGGNNTVTTALRDYLTVDDLNAVEHVVAGIQAASPILEMHDTISLGGGRQRDSLILGVSEQYPEVRKLVILSGRFFDQQDAQTHSKVTLVTEKFALRQYGSTEAAIGQEIKLKGLPFVIIGAFRERVETFGQSEIADETILIPYPVARYFTGTDAVKEIYFSMTDAGMVPLATQEIYQVIKSRHRAESVYHVENFTELLNVATQTANALTVVLLLISTVTLVVSGVGIMNIMLATVRSRIREIGIRKAVGATRREIQLQFLTEAVFISLSGGLVGIAIGLVLPFSIRFFTNYHIPISGVSVFVALAVACLVGIVFGTVPATRAAQLDPVEALKYE